MNKQLTTRKKIWVTFSSRFFEMWVCRKKDTMRDGDDAP